MNLCRSTEIDISNNDKGVQELLTNLLEPHGDSNEKNYNDV